MTLISRITVYYYVDVEFSAYKLMNTVLDLNDRGETRSVIQWLSNVRSSGNIRLMEFSEVDAQSVRLVLGLLKRNFIRSPSSKTFDASWHQYPTL